MQSASRSPPSLPGRRMTPRQRQLRVALALLGVAGLVLRPSYHGPFGSAVHAYGGSLAVSFGRYFVTTIASEVVTRASPHVSGRLEVRGTQTVPGGTGGARWALMSDRR